MTYNLKYIKAYIKLGNMHVLKDIHPAVLLMNGHHFYTAGEMLQVKKKHI